MKFKASQTLWQVFESEKQQTSERMSNNTTSEWVSKQQLRHIDNSFFHLTAEQAKALSIDGQLPANGWQKKADLAKLAECELVYRAFGSGQIRPCAFQASEAKRAWIQRTPLSWWDGEPTANGWVWAVMVCS